MTSIVIMAGGEGTRLRPLTVHKPKPLVKVLNLPVLTYNLLRIRELGFKEVKITLHYLPQTIISQYDDGSDLGMKIEYSIEERPLGTAGGVREAFEQEDRVIVISGDLITDLDLRSMLDFHIKKGSLMTIALSYAEEPYQFGIAKLDEEGKILRYLEKPSPTEVFSKFINAGMYIIEPEVLKRIPKSMEYDFSRDLIPDLLSKKEAIYGFYSNCYWRDIGTIEQYLSCNIELLQGKSEQLLKIAKENQRLHDSLKDAEIRDPCFINYNAQIKKGAKIGPFAVIDEDVKVGEYSKINSSIIAKGAILGDRCAISSSIIDSYVRIGDKVTIFDGCVIGERTIIGKGAEIRPNVRIWPGRQIDEFAVVLENIVSAMKISRKPFSKGNAIMNFGTEASPEFFVKLGKSIAIISKGDIAFASSNKKLSITLGHPLLSAIISEGKNARNVNVIPIPIFRNSMKLINAEYGVYCSRIMRNILEISLIDKTGANIEEKIEKKLENILLREEFPVLELDELKEILEIKPNELANKYKDSLEKNLIEDFEKINEIKIVSLNQELDNFINLFYYKDKKNLKKEIEVILNNDFSKCFLKIEDKNLDKGIQALLMLKSAKEILQKRIALIPYYYPDFIIDYLKDQGYIIEKVDPKRINYSRFLYSKDYVYVDMHGSFLSYPVAGVDGLHSALLLALYLSIRDIKKALEEIPSINVNHDIIELQARMANKIIEVLKNSDGARIEDEGIVFEEEEGSYCISLENFSRGLEIISIAKEERNSLKLLEKARKQINKAKSLFS